MLMFFFTTTENAFYALLGALLLRSSLPSSLPSFLFAFGLNIRGGAHLRTSTGVAQKRGSQVVTILQGNFREKGRSGKLEQEQNSPSLGPTFWRYQ